MASPVLRLRFSALLLFCLCVLIWQLTYVAPNSGSQRLKSLWRYAGFDKPPDLSAANATLGFQVVLSVSAEDQNSTHAWRRAGLIRAANRTGINIDIPHQRDYTYKELKALRDGKPDDEDPARPKEEQALAWLGHLDALQRVIDAQATTAFILEDDSDWDVSLPQQLLNISTAVRNITNATSSPEIYPYGLDWDVLWLGHCGDVFDKSDPEIIGIYDPSIPPVDSLKLVWSVPDFYQDFPPHTRMLHKVASPMCSFAYAVTLNGAKKVKRWASSTGEAFDVKLHHGCRTGALMCLSVAPEVVHHQRMIGAKSLSHGEDPLKKTMPVEPAEQSDNEGSSGEVDGAHPLGSDGFISPDPNKDPAMPPSSHGFFTYNILHSARCNWDRGDDELIECVPNEKEREEFPT